jgi:carbon monoxide dehydrogenase subunit G
VQIGGAIARVGQRLLSGVSKMMMDRFFECLRQKIV